MILVKRIVLNEEEVLVGERNCLTFKEFLVSHGILLSNTSCDDGQLLSEPGYWLEIKPFDHDGVVIEQWSNKRFEYKVLFWSPAYQDWLLSCCYHESVEDFKRATFVQNGKLLLETAREVCENANKK